VEDIFRDSSVLMMIALLNIILPLIHVNEHHFVEIQLKILALQSLRKHLSAKMIPLAPLRLIRLQVVLHLLGMLVILPHLF